MKRRETGYSFCDQCTRRCSFRPENATIVEVSKAMLAGRVSAAFFLGDRTRLIVEGVGQEKLTIEADGRAKYSEGDQIGIDIDPESVLTL